MLLAVFITPSAGVVEREQSIVNQFYVSVCLYVCHKRNCRSSITPWSGKLLYNRTG